jgi:hypothetical protein
MSVRRHHAARTDQTENDIGIPARSKRSEPEFRGAMARLAPRALESDGRAGAAPGVEVALGEAGAEGIGVPGSRGLAG